MNLVTVNGWRIYHCEKGHVTALGPKAPVVCATCEPETAQERGARPPAEKEPVKHER